MIDMADRLREMLGAKARNFVEGKFRPRRNHEIIIIDRRAVFDLNALLVGMHPLGTSGDEADVLALGDCGQIDLDVGGLSPADGDPGIRWDEMKRRVLADQGQMITLAQLWHEFVSH